MTGKSKVEEITFEELWNRINTNEIKTKDGIKRQHWFSGNLYADPISLRIYDMEKTYVKVKRIVRNINLAWYDLTFKSDIEELEDIKLTCTLDHPLAVIDRGRISADELNIGDKVLYKYGSKKIPVTLVNKHKYLHLGYSYDVTTSSDRFMVNHLNSHNCRAFLSPYYERGGFEPADENDRPVFTGRWNGGVVSLHLPMILQKARQENKDFYEVLDYYLEMIRNVHKRTKEYLGELRASVNPLQFCEGGFYRGHLNPSDKIKPLLDYVTFSYGITALNELNRLYNGKSIREDGEFPLEVMKYINNKINQYKKEDHILYAIYGTPAKKNWHII